MLFPHVRPPALIPTAYVSTADSGGGCRDRVRAKLQELRIQPRDPDDEDEESAAEEFSKYYWSSEMKWEVGGR